MSIDFHPKEVRDRPFREKAENEILRKNYSRMTDLERLDDNSGRGTGILLLDVRWTVSLGTDGTIGLAGKTGVDTVEVLAGGTLKSNLGLTAESVTEISSRDGTTNVIGNDSWGGESLLGRKSLTDPGGLVNTRAGTVLGPFILPEGTIVWIRLGNLGVWPVVNHVVPTILGDDSIRV